MTTQSFVIAVDIGTTSAKTLLIDRNGKIHQTENIEYPLYTPMPDRAEQDPDTLFRAVVQGIKQVVHNQSLLPEQILCVSFSSAMHSLIAVDEAGNTLSSCWTWADNRSAAYADELKRTKQGQEIYERTGTPIHPMSPLLKLLWMKDHEPKLFQSTNKFIGIKEYVFHRWFGEYAVDHSIASATGMFNLRSLDWDSEVLDLIGISPDKLSLPVHTTTVFSGLDAAYAQEMGLSSSTKIVIGASDGVLANVGVGAITPGTISVTIGTSGAVRGVIKEPLTDPQGRLFCYALTEDQWVIGGAINNGGILFRWVRDQLATLETKEAISKGIEPYDYLAKIAETVPAGSEGLLFLPLLTGERAPYWDANARGVFFGLSLYHEKKHMIRAVLEGVAFAIRSVLAPLEEVGGQAVQIRASGGFARSQLWRQIMSDVLQTPLIVPDSIESSCLGAAQLGLVAIGEQTDFSSIHEWIAEGTQHQVNAEAARQYKQLSAIYDTLYPSLKESFAQISAIQVENHK